MKLFEMTALELSRLLQKKEVSAVEVTQSFIERAGEVEPLVQAYITRTPETALAEAEAVDEKRKRGEALHPLAGVPLAVKDNICSCGVRTTCASRFLEQYIPPEDATVVQKARAAGMPLLGKTNLDEFAMGSSTESSAFFPTRNPWNLSRVPGGSSGGSAAAVSSGSAPLALGSDTGGSVRQPAAFCGVVGLRPTYGRVSRAGLIALASSLDQAGPFALTAADAALFLQLIAGQDRADFTTSDEAVPSYLAALPKGVQGLRVGLLVENVPDHFDAEIITAIQEAAKNLADNGAVVEEVSLPHTGASLEAYHLICAAEASSNLGRFDGVIFGRSAAGENINEMYSRSRGEGLGPEVKRRLLLGTYILCESRYEAYYMQAMRVRTLIRRDYESAFKRFDLLLGAVTPTTAFKLGEKLDDPLAMYHADICILHGPLAGVPAISVPYGFDSGGLPIGVQLTAAPFREEILFRAAHFLEQSRGPEPLRPQLSPSGS
ncbi:MAG: Asp-tRNA(Asn)/Glu-tRNA(Gln) amidotransferase subunit GatA [Dethiobacteria bacterium]|jgi:aspartyl-tRNA(Asn)/glutamyl-tRNA(Gln) amidotransferase subunit A|nr:Asp-tRNA(Asn)/Glu-tRNA(Gln) amidotransferase subunit GatA [Bacillota bacterium]